MVPLFVLGALVLEVEAIQDPQTQGHDYSLISTRNAFNLSNEPPHERRPPHRPSPQESRPEIHRDLQVKGCGESLSGSDRHYGQAA